MTRWLALPLALATPPAIATAKETPPVTHDFSTITSAAAAAQAGADGKLERILLFPAEFGGEDRPENVVYVTAEAVALRATIIGTLQRFHKAGTIDRLTVTPEYRGDSFVPTRLTFHAGNSRTGGAFEPAIEVW